VTNKEQKSIFIKLVRSGIGFSHKQKRQIRALGFSKLNQVVERPDTPQIRGLVNAIRHLVKVVREPQVAAWATTPEYTVKPPEPAVAPASNSEGKREREASAKVAEEAGTAKGSETESESSGGEPVVEPKG
jgi:large subunit ribosomal protein L30